MSIVMCDVSGLEEPGWEIVKRTKTPQEIREEYEEDGGVCLITD